MRSHTISMPHSNLMGSVAVSKKQSLIWIQSLTCNGDAHSFLNHPQLAVLLSRFEILYHPLLPSLHTLDTILKGETACDILIVDGAIREQGCQRGGREIYPLIVQYAQEASWVVTVGTCATFGGIFKEADPEVISGLCFDREKRHVRYESYASKLISLPGCPAHPEWIAYVLDMLHRGQKIPIDTEHRPLALYGTTVHAGCRRNEYFEWKVDTEGFGAKEGCLYYQQGCQAPYTRGSCNQIPWNGISSKTTVGTPCFGCTEPTFPKQKLFRTKTHMGIPAQMPLGVPRRAYLTLTGVAKSFTIQRFKERIICHDSQKTD